MSLRASIFRVESIFLINLMLLNEFGEGTTKQLVNAELKRLMLEARIQDIEKQINSRYSYPKSCPRLKFLLF